MKKRLNTMMKKLESGRFAPLIQFIKFGLVGVSNTLISYATEMLGYYVLFTGMASEQAKVILVTAIGFIISTINSYYWNNRFVFTGKERSAVGHLQAYAKMAACYALTGLILAPAMKLWLVNINVPFWIASLSTLLLTIPLNFILNKFWAFRK